MSRADRHPLRTTVILTVLLILIGGPSMVLARTSVDGKMYTAAGCVPATVQSGIYQAALGAVTVFNDDYSPKYGDLRHTFTGHAYNAMNPFDSDTPDTLTVICPVVREHGASDVHMVVVSVLFRAPIPKDFCTFMTFTPNGYLYDSRSTWERLSNPFEEIQTFRLVFDGLPATEDLGPMLLMCHLPKANLLSPSQMEQLPDFASYIYSYRIEERYKN